INDWGGVSPVTPDHVNPEAPWPHLADLARATERAGRTLVERLAIYPEFLAPARVAEPAPGDALASSMQPSGPRPRSQRGPALGPSVSMPGAECWLEAALITPTLRQMDAAGLAREDGWAPGGLCELPGPQVARVRQTTRPLSPVVAHVLARARDGMRLSETDIVALFDARGADFAAVCRAADELRA